MSRLFFVISLIFALLALQGWPVDGGVWMRALMALASVMIGTGLMVLLAPATTSQRFKSTRRPRAWDQLAGALCIAAAFGALYAILALAPPATSRFSEYVVSSVRIGFGLEQNDEEPDEEEADALTAEEEGPSEVGAMFDPNGALVPKTASLTLSDEPSRSLKMADRATAEALHASGQLYLHLFSHNHFNGERWISRSNRGAVYYAADAQGLVHLQRPIEAPAHAYTVLHHKLSNGIDAMCTLQGARFVRLPEIMQLNEGTWLLPPPDATGIIRPYDAGSTPRKFSELIADEVPIAPGDAGPEHLARTTDVGLNIQIIELAERFRQLPTLEAQLVELREWLSTSFGYTLDMDFPDKDKSAIESFLDQPGTGEGFCVHFASAAALIARELGVPSRVSYGWTGGEYYPEHDQFVFRAGDGHAWAELFLEGQGWVVFEATPTSALPQPEAQPLEAEPPTVEEVDDDDREPAGKPQPWPHWKWVVLPLGVGAAVLFALLLWKRGRLARGSYQSRESAAKSPPGYLQHFYRTCAAMGHPKPAGSTLLQYLEQLDGEDVAIPFSDELLTYHYKVTYREGARDADVEKQLRRRIKEL